MLSGTLFPPKNTLYLIPQVMLKSLSRDSLLPSANSDITAKAVPCKFLFSREQLLFCHIQMPDVPEKVPAITHEDRYYSIFKTVGSAQATLELAIKLGNNSNELAITQAGQRYIVWVNEPDATLISAQVDRIRTGRMTFKAANCLILPGAQSYKFTQLIVPDLTHRVPGFQHNQRYYSLLHRVKEVAEAINAVAELACRGIELALVPLLRSYAICIFEPNASQVDT